MRITVTVDSQHTGKVEEVASHLGQAGMQVEHVLGSLGMITGTVDETAVSALQAVEGVASFDRQLDVHLPPPDSGLQ